MNDNLSHTCWKCKCHLVFAPKFRRQNVYGKIREDVGRILRTLCEQKKVEIDEAEACPDHIHMLVSIPPHLSQSVRKVTFAIKFFLLVFGVGLNPADGHSEPVRTLAWESPS